MNAHDQGEQIAELERQLSECRDEVRAFQRARQCCAETLEHMREAFFALDGELVVTRFNRAAETLLKRKREEVVGCNLFEAFPEAQHSVFEEKYTTALREHRALSFETYFGTPPYEDWYDVRVFPFQGGLSVYFCVTTSQKESERALHKAQERYRSITETAVDAIFQRHGGYIEAESEECVGTRMTAYLPASRTRGVELPRVAAPRHAGHGHILIMDDQEPVLRMLRRVLQGLGYQTSSALDGAQAIDLYGRAMASRHPFAMVILDLTVPGGMGGAETVRELIKINPNVIAVVSSGYATDPVMSNFRDYGFRGVVSKPYTRDQLVDLLDGLLGAGGGAA